MLADTRVNLSAACLQLTSLCALDQPWRCQPSAALAGLSHLQRCCLGSVGYELMDPETTAAPLPPGPWAAGLRSLGASLDVLSRSTAVLSAATQLTRLALTGGSLTCAEQQTFWEWAGRHPPLQQLLIEVDEGLDVPAAAVHAMSCLAHGRPALQVTTGLAGDTDLFWVDFVFEA